MPRQTKDWKVCLQRDGKERPGFSTASVFSEVAMDSVHRALTQSALNTGTSTQYFGMNSMVFVEFGMSFKEAHSAASLHCIQKELP